MRERFELEGKTYYQQYRKCSKTACHCQDDGDQGHGPYWYARDDRGRRSYVGRDLPEDVQRAHATHERRTNEIYQARRRIADQFDAITRLLCNKALHDGDREIIETLGFADCLVSEPELAIAQDGLVPTGGLQATQDADRGLVHRPGQGRAQERVPARLGAL